MHMPEYDSEEHSRRTYRAAKGYILRDPKDPFGEGMAKQLISEAVSFPFKILGIALLVLKNGLRKNPEKIEEVREKLGK